MPATEIIAHRGASHDAPENTLAAFQLGWAQGADGNELDLRLTQDGQLIVCHDANTKRTAGLDQPVAAQTFRELRALDAGAWKGPRWRGEKLPSLDEVIATMPDGKRLFIEIKSGLELLPPLEKTVRASGKHPAQLNLMSFDLDVITMVKKRLPNHAAYWIVARKKTEAPPSAATLQALLTGAQAAGLDGLDLEGVLSIDRVFVTKMKAAGLKLYTWTIDDLPLARRLLEAGVDGLTTNRPGWLRAQLGL
jgi:glycerophosphoryl diester phosphodiesterase